MGVGVVVGVGVSVGVAVGTGVGLATGVGSWRRRRLRSRGRGAVRVRRRRGRRRRLGQYRERQVEVCVLRTIPPARVRVSLGSLRGPHIEDHRLVCVFGGRRHRQGVAPILDNRLRGAVVVDHGDDAVVIRDGRPGRRGRAVVGPRPHQLLCANRSRSRQQQEQCGQSTQEGLQGTHLCLRNRLVSIIPQAQSTGTQLRAA